MKLFRIEKVALFLRRDRVRKTLESDFEFSNSFFEFLFETEISRRKKQRSFFVLKSTNLNNYHDKNFKKYQDWTRNARNVFEKNVKYFRKNFDKITWIQQFFRDTSATRWNNQKRIYADWITTFTWNNFVKYLKRFIEKSKNRRFETSKKYNQIKQSQNQSVFEFVIYIKIFEYELKSFIETQKRNHFLNRLKSNINQMINESIDIFRTRDAFATRTTRIDNVRSKNSDQNNHEVDFNQTSQTINFFEKRFRNKRNGDSTTIIIREFNNLTIRSKFDDQKRSNINI